jgi:transcriptional regulator with XRE-family HTH domain
MSRLARPEDYSPGLYGLPHMGEVITDHRLKAGGTSQEACAIVCGVDKQTVAYWENQRYLADMDRRIFLSKLLKIPPALLGLNWRSLLTDDEVPSYIKGSESMAELLSTNAYGLYEDILKFAHIAPGKYSTESAYRFYKHQQEIENILEAAPALEKESWQDLLCRYYQHTIFIALHNVNNAQALLYANKAVELSTSLEHKDTELVGSSHYKRARVYLTLNKRESAKEDIQEALNKAEHVRSPLRGSTYLLAAEVNALDAPQDGLLRTQCRKWQDDAATLLYKKKIEDDGTFIMFNLYAVHHERAKTLLRFALFHISDDDLTERLKDKYIKADATLIKDSRSALIAARKHLESTINPSITMDCTITEARLLLVGKEYEESAKLTKNALIFARASHSGKGINEIGKIHTILSQIVPQCPYVCNLGVELGRF